MNQRAGSVIPNARGFTSARRRCSSGGVKDLLFPAADEKNIGADGTNPNFQSKKASA